MLNNDSVNLIDRKESKLLNIQEDSILRLNLIFDFSYNEDDSLYILSLNNAIEKPSYMDNAKFKKLLNKKDHKPFQTYIPFRGLMAFDKSIRSELCGICKYKIMIIPNSLKELRDFCLVVLQPQISSFIKIIIQNLENSLRTPKKGLKSQIKALWRKECKKINSFSDPQTSTTGSILSTFFQNIPGIMSSTSSDLNENKSDVRIIYGYRMASQSCMKFLNWKYSLEILILRLI